MKHPDVGEIIFADFAGRAHARRWTNRKKRICCSRWHRYRSDRVKAMHDAARRDQSRLIAAIKAAVVETWPLAAAMELASR